MAYIKKCKKGYRIRLVLGYDINNKRINKNITYYPKAKKETAQLKEAQAYANELERNIKNGDYFNSNSLTLNQFYKEWLNNYASKYLSRSKIESYSFIMEKIFLSKLGYIDINKITALQLQNIETYLEKTKKLKASTIKTYFTAISSIFNKAYTLGIIKENIVKRVQLPKIESNKNEYNTFNELQAKAFLKALESEYYINHKEHARTLKSSRTSYKVPSYVQKIEISTMWKAFFTLALFSGARRGELIALTWNDIDFNNNTISINKATASTKEGQLIKEPKTKSGIRSFILPYNVFLKLREWKEEQQALCYNLGSKWQGKAFKCFNDNFIFTGNEGKQLNLSTPTHKLREIITLYNNSVSINEALPLIRLHDLRHFSASLLIANGIDVATVSARLGHSKTSITLDRYTHALKTIDEKASNTLENIFNEERESKVLQA